MKMILGKLRSCIDLLEDTEYAIINFCEYQLSKNRISEDLGEMYLRLYGVLNAIYLQKQAMIEIAELVKFSSKKALIKALNKHDAIIFRNKIAAHAVNYLDTGKVPKSTSNSYFRLTQIDISPQANKLSIVGGAEKYTQINLKEVVADFGAFSEKEIIDVVGKYVSSLCKNDKSFLEELQASLSDLKLNPTDYSKFDRTKNIELEMEKELGLRIKNIRESYNGFNEANIDK